MRACVVFSLVLSVPGQATGLGKRLHLFCVEWDVKPQLVSQSITRRVAFVLVSS